MNLQRFKLDSHRISFTHILQWSRKGLDPHNVHFRTRSCRRSSLKLSDLSQSTDRMDSNGAASKAFHVHRNPYGLQWSEASGERADSVDEMDKSYVNLTSKALSGANGKLRQGEGHCGVCIGLTLWRGLGNVNSTEVYGRSGKRVRGMQHVKRCCLWMECLCWKIWQVFQCLLIRRFDVVGLGRWNWTAGTVCTILYWYWKEYWSVFRMEKCDEIKRYRLW